MEGMVDSMVDRVVEGGGGGVSTPVEGGAPPDLTPQEERNASLLRLLRGRLHDLPEARFTQVLDDLRAQRSVRSIARGLIEQGFCAHLKPKTVERYVTLLRDALGLPVHMEPYEVALDADKELEPDEPVEAFPVMKRLAWLIRTQQARVRKALEFEGNMAGMILPMASQEIKLLSDLMDKEIEVALKTGDLKTVPLR